MDFEKELSEIYPWILRVARRFCRSIQDAEDLAGDTVYKVLVNREKFDASKPLKPWCIAVMQNTYITQYNRNSLVNFIGYDSVSENVSSDYASNLVMFNDVVSAIHRCARKSCSIDSLMYCAQGYSYDEISELLNVPVSTIRNRISFGRKMVLRELDY
ncbi:RNA polymerase sigma factor [Bacteroides caccae]|jgi:RNA polymerase sigma-70 factor (ECF subfamily)|uniref:RNA polymerase sigma factor n=1 Tax=Bacteroides caccae TaxID=47678 RepID=UPI0020634B97|nr:RNA polymerase sigma factor [Bacteroides caccae]MCS2366446.1 RNA polymerase sigma factor [Bacteroides caccae]MCS3190883.1 RNA polymerase sigma factor [Bacteroides caccae]DAM43763.1 MAG TPA: DNA-directed RNA polymerase specialized sigma subunit-like protein [Caudoviricetes sp.]